MKSAIEISQYFLKLSEPEVGDAITNLKLQKLLYYAQGISLALGEPIFGERIVNWEHGPVVEEVYHKFKDFGANPIPPIEDLNPEFTERETEILDDVYEVYGQFSAWKLRNMTHSEMPWNSTSRNEEITHELLTNFFKTQLA